MKKEVSVKTHEVEDLKETVAKLWKELNDKNSELAKLKGSNSQIGKITSVSPKRNNDQKSKQP